jgi:hypothetical protein
MTGARHESGCQLDSCTHRWRALLYYYISVYSRAATNLDSPA